VGKRRVLSLFRREIREKRVWISNPTFLRQTGQGPHGTEGSPGRVGAFRRHVRHDRKTAGIAGLGAVTGGRLWHPRNTSLGTLMPGRFGKADGAAGLRTGLVPYLQTPTGTWELSPRGVDS
jgi:hypothetical protein